MQKQEYLFFTYLGVEEGKDHLPVNDFLTFSFVLRLLCLPVSLGSAPVMAVVQSLCNPCLGVPLLLMVPGAAGLGISTCSFHLV